MSKVGLSGNYQLRAIKAATGEVMRETTVFSNLITNSGFEAIMDSGIRNIQSFEAGSSSREPSVTDTGIVSLIGSSTNTVTFPDTYLAGTGGSYYIVRKFRSRGNEGAIVGNVAEIAIKVMKSSGSGSGGYPLLSRALVKDSNNNPTTITVLADEYLEIDWVLYQYIMPESSGFINIEVDGVLESFGYQMKPYALNDAVRAGDSASVRASMLFEHSVISRDILTGSRKTGRDTFISTKGVYSNKSIKYTYSLALNTGNNVSGINCLYLHFDGFLHSNYQLVLSRPIMKSPTNKLEIPITFYLDNASPPE